jgi:hypothetical protein
VKSHAHREPGIVTLCHSSKKTRERPGRQRRPSAAAGARGSCRRPPCRFSTDIDRRC